MNTALETTAETPAATPREIDRLLAHYGESHRNPTNEVIHFTAIPVIMLSLLGLIYSIHPWVAYVFLAASGVYYLRLSGVFFVGMLAWTAILLALVYAMGNQVMALSAGLFVGAWIMQFIGHKIEGKKPSFFEDIRYLWVGPLFVLSKLFERLNIHW